MQDWANALLTSRVFMPVVDVREVRMVVHERSMVMDMAVGFNTVPLKLMAMLVVSIVLMLVSMP